MLFMEIYLFIYLLDFQQSWGKAKQVWKPPIDKPPNVKFKNNNNKIEIKNKIN